MVTAANVRSGKTTAELQVWQQGGHWDAHSGQCQVSEVPDDEWVTLSPEQSSVPTTVLFNGFI